MSYDIHIRNKRTGHVAELKDTNEHFGGTFAIGGTPLAEFNITYNYWGTFRRLFGEDGIRSIYGKPVKDTLDTLRKASADLGDVEPTDDYWEPTDGNVKAALDALVDLQR